MGGFLSYLERRHNERSEGTQEHTDLQVRFASRLIPSGYGLQFGFWSGVPDGHIMLVGLMHYMEERGYVTTQ